MSDKIIKKYPISSLISSIYCKFRVNISSIKYMVEIVFPLLGNPYKDIKFLLCEYTEYRFSIIVEGLIIFDYKASSNRLL